MIESKAVSLVKSHSAPLQLAIGDLYLKTERFLINAFKMLKHYFAQPSVPEFRMRVEMLDEHEIIEFPGGYK